MKGFIKILEAILASIVILIALTFFFNIDVKQTDWDNILLQIRAEDVLASLVNNGTITEAIYTSNPSLINNSLLDTTLGMLPATIDYSLEIRGIPNPVIYIGCNCTDASVADLENRLSPLDFKYKGRDISIRIAQDSLENTRSETDILFLHGYKDLKPYSSSLEKFLENGGTIFMLGDLTQSQVEDGFMNTTFGLNWSINSRSNTGIFVPPDNENFTSKFRIEKYYNNLTNDTPIFGFAGAASIGIEDDHTIIISYGGTSLVKVNKDIVSGNGRTVWMSDYVQSSATNNLTKAVIMWASGEEFRLNREKAVPPKHLETRYIIRDKDTYEAVLSLWRIFQ